ncbi:hypothetical protein L0152_07445 [bacterium]|nr:hypothetical protein [bacterium]
MIPEWVMAYTAGILDGEGSLVLSKSHSRKRKDGSRKSIYQPNIQVTTSDDVITVFMKTHWGGALCIRKRTYLNPKWKDANMWYLTGYKKLIPFLESVIPYLQLKRAKAVIMLEFCKSRNRSWINTKRSEQTYQPHELQMIERFRGVK